MKNSIVFQRKHKKSYKTAKFIFKVKINAIFVKVATSQHIKEIANL